MQIFSRLRTYPALQEHGFSRAAKFWIAALLVAGSAAFSAAVHAQVQPAGDKGGASLTVGALGSGEALDYGSRKMLGITGFADIDTRRRIGVEAEARWLEFHRTANVHAETYSIGLRYHFDFGSRFQPYAKALIGYGRFNFPYNFGADNDLVLTGGAGVDYWFSPRIHWRALDFEYQSWPQFSFGAMNTAAVSSGLSVRIF